LAVVPCNPVITSLFQVVLRQEKPFLHGPGIIVSLGNRTLLANRPLTNSEFYMNCAKITVTGGGTGFNGPALFVANLAAVNSVKTELGTDVIYPDPGTSVEFGGDGKTSPPIGVAAAAPKVQGNGASVPVVGGPTTMQTVGVPAPTKVTSPKVCAGKRKRDLGAHIVYI
jgi:hypothetical protein